MNQFLDKIKLWFLGVFDKTADFCREKWEEQRILCVAVLALIVLIILLLIMIPSVTNDQGKKKASSAQELSQEVEIEPFLTIPPEPSIEDDYVYTRKDVARWISDAVENWFSEPDEEMLGELKKANDKLIDDMMEVVP